MKNDSVKNSANRQKKSSIIDELTGKVEKSKGFVFANYQGLTHQQLEVLKKAVKAVDSEFVATKNTLMLRALHTVAIPEEDKKHFEQPTATLFIYGDIVEPIKQLAKTVKELSLPKIKFGIIEGKVISADDVAKLSTLPSKDTLRAQLLGMINSPIQNLHRALNWNMQSLVITLNEIASKKSQAPSTK